MKKFMVMFFLLMIVFMSGISAFAVDMNKRWMYPRQIKTYIPPNHNRTIMMRHAFAEWSRLTNNKFIFKYVTSPQNAQVKVYFVKSIPNADREVGLTKFWFTNTGKMAHADIYIADKTARGRTLGKDAVYTVMLHEIGHAMGISEHSKNPLSIMYPTENDAQEILKSDLKTLAEIYGW